MEPFIVGAGIGCLIGVAAACLIVSRPKEKDVPSWLELLDEQDEALERFAEHQQQPRAYTRLTNRERTITL